MSSKGAANEPQSTPESAPSQAARLRAAAGRRSGRAFTLIEMLIAIGAVGLIAVGLAKLFASTGEVVKIGRRTSNMNEMATTIEAQIRRNVANIAGQGDGFIVIRNKRFLADPATINPATNDYFGIRLSADDRNPNPRPRRIDEFLFFAHGTYTSAREPQFPGRAARGAAARIYYGHGMQRDIYAVPQLDSDPLWGNPAGGWPAGLGRAGSMDVNLYAGNWTLLRQVTVLARPQTTVIKDPLASVPTLPPYLQGNRWKDSAVQNALQPAAASIFRFDPLNITQPDIKGYGYWKVTAYNPVTKAATYAQKQLPMPAPGEIARLGDTTLNNNSWPSTASGIVNVANIDLAVIRSRVLGMPGLLGDESFFGVPVAQSTFTHTVLTGNAIPNFTLVSTDYTKNTVHAQKMLMASALPGNDPWLFGAAGPVLAHPDAPSGGTTGATGEQRMIYAPKPPDFTGNLSVTTNSPLGQPYDAKQPYRQQDQAMLSASNLAVGCTEFIVEWSFGDVFNANAANPNDPRTGQIIWHGRYRDDGSGNPVQPYRNGPDYLANSIPDGHAVPAALIHWPVNIPQTGAAVPWLPVGGAAWDEQQPVYSFFGYQDPTYPGPTDPPGVRDWPWPKLLRFTIALTDPTDPTFEQVLQFVVEVPSRQRLQ